MALFSSFRELSHLCPNTEFIYLENRNGYRLCHREFSDYIDIDEHDRISMTPQQFYQLCVEFDNGGSLAVQKYLRRLKAKDSPLYQVINQ